ncbi:MAG: hypothetical protein IJM39_05545 [Firmicutes bacterium]|nr:hypothetical protein [Bacillota bacterium]
MKKIISTIEVFAGLTIKRMFVVLGSMAALELILFWIFGLSRQVYTFENAVIRSFIPVVFCAAYLAMYWALAWFSGRNSTYRYTLQRLTLSERSATAVQTVYYALCFLLFLLTQVVLTVLMAKLFEGGKYFSEGAQGIFIDMRYNTYFLYNLVPLWTGVQRVKSLLCIILAAIAAAHMNVSVRRGYTPVISFILAAAAAMLWAMPIVPHMDPELVIPLFIFVILIPAGTLYMTYSRANKGSNVEDIPWD